VRRLPIASALLVVVLGRASPLPAEGGQDPLGPTRSARPTHSFPVDAQIDRAFASLERRDTPTAAAILRPLVARADLTPRQQARAQRGLGLTALHGGRPEDAAGHFERALEAASAAGDRSESGWARRWLGTVDYGKGQLEKARGYWNAALEDFAAAGDATGRFEALDDLAVSTPGLARRPFLEQALVIAQERHDDLLEGRARARWAHALLVAARPGAALIEVDRAVTLLRPLGASAHAALGDALATLAWALRAHGSNERAVSVQREGIRIATNAGDIDGQVWGYYGLGIALVELHRYDDADAAMRRARSLASRTGSQTTIRILSESDGWVAMKRGDWARAVPALEASVASKGIDLSAMPFVNLAQAYRRVSRYTDALRTATRGVAIAQELGLEDNELHALTEVAAAQAGLGERSSAEVTLRGVLERLERYRSALAPSDFLKQGFGDRFTDAYGLIVRVLMDDARAGDALAAAERVRARAFADLLLARRMREREDADTSRWLLGAAAAEAAPPHPVDSPATARPLETAEFTDLARRLSTTVVVYWIHESGSYAWVVGPEGRVKGARLSVDAERLRRRIARAAEPPAMDMRAERATSRVDLRVYSALYQQLWAPVAGWIPASRGSRVTIVPHGPLFACPFGALRDPDGRYLLERYALHYAASGHVLREAVARAAEPSPGLQRALLVADPGQAVPNDAVRREPLPASREEVRAIARSLPMPSDVLVGRHATESAVRASLASARVVHFATHALVTESDPLGSHLVLGGNGRKGGDDDGRLTASEVADLRLSADLVALGACRSARGAVSSDGIAGLTRAFMAAGAPSVVATLWDVNDQSTARVMSRFYEAYAAHRPKDAALRAAQLAVLADLRAGRVKARLGESVVADPEHPWFWSAPILVGAP
jgi:CHAT domain-containing protein/tetratricopeptide (TPR) repeat protein